MILGAWIFSKIYNHNLEEEIKNNRFQTVAKVYEISYGAKNVSIKYKFRYNDKIYVGGIPGEKIEKDDVLNNYFKIDISTKNPEKNKIHFDKEVFNKQIIDSLDL